MYAKSKQQNGSSMPFGCLDKTIRLDVLAHLQTNRTSLQNNSLINTNRINSHFGHFRAQSIAIIRNRFIFVFVLVIRFSLESIPQVNENWIFWLWRKTALLRNRFWFKKKKQTKFLLWIDLRLVRNVVHLMRWTNGKKCVFFENYKQTLRNGDYLWKCLHSSPAIEVQAQ